MRDSAILMEEMPASDFSKLCPVLFHDEVKLLEKYFTKAVFAKANQVQDSLNIWHAQLSDFNQEF